MSKISSIPYYDLSSKASLTADQTFTGSQTLTPSSTSTIPLVIQSVSGQTVNNIRVVGTTSNTIMSVGSGGSIYGQTLSLASSFSGTQLIGAQPFSASVVPMVLRGAASQTANLTEWQSSAGSILARVSSTGAITSGSFNATFNATVTSGSASQLAFMVRGAASQSANLQEWQASDGTVLASVNSLGRAGFDLLSAGSNGHLGLGQLSVVSTSATRIGAVIRGAASQTGNLLEWQDSTGAQLGYILSSGSIYTSGRIIAGSDLSSKIQATASTATQIPLILRGAASQSANLAEFQSSAGTILAQVESNGTIRTSQQIALSGNVVALSTQNSGGVMTMARSTSQATNPGANFARLYLRDGTTAGTLKLVVRAGAAGAETTILDDIPQ